MRAGWETRALGDLSAISYGYTESATLEPVGPKFLRITDIQDDCVDWETVPFCQIEAAKLEKYKLATGDIVFARTGATTGKSFLVSEPPEAVFASYLIRLRLQHKGLSPQFVSLFFQTQEYWNAIRQGSSGSAQGGFNASKLAALKIPFPDIPEQQRIVAILDKAFAGIATARAAAEQNRQSGRSLFESYLQSVFSQRGDGWLETTIADATGGVFTGPFGSLLHKSDYIENGIPLVNPAHITNVGIEPDLRKTVSAETAQRLSSYIMRTGDIVIGRRGEMGRCAIVTDAEDGWLCGTGSFVIKPSNRCDASYLVRLLRSESCKSRLEEIAGGAVMPNLSNTALGNFPILLPPIDMQKAVLEEIDSLHEETQRLEALYQRKLEALDELKQSLLHQVFSGQL